MDWYHFSGDYHIGATYLKDEIINNITKKMKQDPWLQNLLDNQSISVNSQVTFDNLEPISAFLGKVGNPEEGGLAIDEFIRRQGLFLEAEIKAMYDVPSFIKQSQQSGYDNFINDAGGSLCELEDKKLYQLLAKNTLIVYIKTNKDAERNAYRTIQKPAQASVLSPRLFCVCSAGPTLKKTAWTMLPK